MIIPLPVTCPLPRHGLLVILSETFFWDTLYSKQNLLVIDFSNHLLEIGYSFHLEPVEPRLFLPKPIFPSRLDMNLISW